SSGISACNVRPICWRKASSPWRRSPIRSGSIIPNTLRITSNRLLTVYRRPIGRAGRRLVRGPPNKTVNLARSVCSMPNPQFIQHVIHDIQGDFLGVAGLCQSMKKGLEEKKDIKGLLDILIENCRTYKYKLGNFLEFTRMQAGLSKTVRGSVDIRRLLNQVIDEYDTLWIEKDA